MGEKVKSSVLIDAIEWEYPEQKRAWKPGVQNILDTKFREMLVLGFGNGIFLEFRIEAESEDVLKYIYSFLDWAGGVRPAELSDEKKQSLWLYQAGGKCWTQTDVGGNDPFAYIMVDPIAHPGRFEARE